ncbi:Telomere repeat-binding factor 1 [Raphanus sativus]|uniref:MYB transcription factor n=1 Tax=Raphanus sativus TaxID=3726 RepID=A0A6J0KIF3_RAPSA|nr:telomere repeat-binding factor 1 [Raphanus sativus]KAJ4881927.1 Telomere repeat-binding factor 1 [Raphanus sativus]
MGAPKHKWSQEEESALRSAIVKHGPGKWRTILKDPDFSRVLYLRSNVDLKDKWRNISVMGYGSGSGSRSKSSVAVKKTHGSLPSDEEILKMVDSKNFSTTGSSALQVPSPRTPNWLDSLINEAISNMKEGGSSKTAIGNYIQERYEVPPNFKTLLSSKLKYLSACGTGKLIKVKRKYSIPNSTALSSHKKRHLGTLSDKKSIPSLSSPETDRDEMSVQTKSEDDAELARMMIVDIHEAAEIAAQAVAEAEAAMVEADEAAKQADVAEAEAEAAQAFAQEVSKTLKGIDNCSR